MYEGITILLLLLLLLPYTVFCFLPSVHTAYPACSVCTLCYRVASLATISYPAAGCGGPSLLHAAQHIITSLHSCRHPNLLADSHAVIVCCPLQVSCGLFGVLCCIGRKCSKLH